MKTTPVLIGLACLVLPLSATEVAQKDNVVITKAKMAEVFVSPSGKDTNPGTSDQPFQTVAKGLGAVDSGGTLHLAEGTYREGDLVATESGTPDKPVIIEGAGRDKTFIKGSVEVPHWEQVNNGPVWKTAWAFNSQQVFCDGKPLQQIGATCGWCTKLVWANRVALPPVGKGLDDVKPGTFLYAAGAGQLYVRLEKQDDPNTHHMEVSVKDWVLSGKTSEYVTIRHLALMHCTGTRNGGSSAVLTFGKSHWTAEDCAINYGDMGGLSMWGTNQRATHCVIDNNGDNGIGMGNTDAAHGFHRYPDAPNQASLIEDCEVNGNNYRNFFAAWHAGGLKLVPGIRGVTVRGCTVEDNKAPGIWFDGPIGENVIEDNLCVNNDAGIFYEIADPPPQCSFSAIIRNNRVCHSRQQGIYVSASTGVVVENNTVYDSWAGIVVHGMPRGTFKLVGNTVRNNIVMGGKVADIILFAGKDSANNSMDGDFYVTGPTALYSKTGLRVSNATSGYTITDTTLASLQAKGLEKNGLEGDPMWVDAAALDLHLKPNSPATGKGWQEKSATAAAK